MKVAIISNGVMFDYEKMKRKLTETYDYVICADGGSNHAFKMDIVPQMIVGDMDSVDINVLEHYKKLDVIIESCDARKDDTDTIIAIKQAISMKPQEIGLFGSSGKRLDHTLANISSLFYIKSQDILGKLIDEYNEIQIADELTIIEGQEGDTISLISLTEWTYGVTLEGLDYPLTDYDICRENQIGVSNVMTGTQCRIRKESGDLLIIKSYE